jgi:hypothetical protein
LICVEDSPRSREGDRRLGHELENDRALFEIDGGDHVRASRSGRGYGERQPLGGRDRLTSVASHID